MALDFVKQLDDLKSHVLRFCLHPESWNSFQSPVSLSWRWVKFAEADRIEIPATRGVYAFVVEPDIVNVLQHGFPLYVGETGDANDRTLRVRYGDYLQNKRRICERHNIHYMLNKWGSHMYFYFAEVPDRRYRLKTIERALNDSLKPPFSIRDFSAEVRPLVKVLRI